MALEGITVLDLGASISAPYCTKLLADYGAGVIKVEPPEGDPARRAGPFPQDIPHPEKSGLFLTLNTNKKGITLDLRTVEGRDILRELVKSADLVVDNYPPGYMDSLGLSLQALHVLNPNLVVTSITPFGLSGPYRDFQTTDLVSFALTNRMVLNGMPEREPLHYAQDVVWFQVGATAAVASLAAVYSSSYTGHGHMVEISAMECLSGNVDARTLFYQYTKRLPRRGTMDIGYPAGAYPCQDGYVAFSAGGDRFFRRFCHAMDRADLLDDPRWSTVEARASNQEPFEELLFGWLMARTKKEVFTICQEHRVMCAPVHTVDELFTDPQLEDRQFFTTVDNPVAGPLTQPGAPFKMTETPWSLRYPAPTLGQHNSEIYCGRLGYSPGDLALLRSMRAI
ncbi:MAG: CoA transferase [Dehalococcoidia bacterium]